MILQPFAIRIPCIFGRMGLTSVNGCTSRKHYSITLLTFPISLDDRWMDGIFESEFLVQTDCISGTSSNFRHPFSVKCSGGHARNCRISFVKELFDVTFLKAMCISFMKSVLGHVYRKAIFSYKRSAKPIPVSCSHAPLSHDTPEK